MSRLEQQFDLLEHDVAALIALLEEADERFWVPYLTRALPQIRARKLAGATFVLGCYGGVDTFSDLVVGRSLEAAEPLRFRNLNARLGELRTRVFDSANAITARRAW